MLNLKRTLIAAGIALATPAHADQSLAVTPSGAAEMQFAEQPLDVVGKLASKCIDARWTVISSTTNELVCESPLSMGQSVMGQLLMGNSYSTPPRRFFRFNVAQVNGISRVQASGWMELQMAFGQMKRTDFAGPEFQNNIFGFMASAGGQYPVGTTFPNHAAMGVKVDEARVGGNLGLRITEVTSASSAERAGLQLGDVVFEIAGKRFKDIEGYLDATARAAKVSTYSVKFERDGKTMEAQLAREFRPAIVSSVVAKENVPSPIEPKTSLPSIADELAKLAKLRDDGLLTEAEFSAQKQKLLAP